MTGHYFPYSRRSFGWASASFGSTTVASVVSEEPDPEEPQASCGFVSGRGGERICFSEQCSISLAKRALNLIPKIQISIEIPFDVCKWQRHILYLLTFLACCHLFLNGCLLLFSLQAPTKSILCQTHTCLRSTCCICFVFQTTSILNEFELEI